MNLTVDEREQVATELKRFASDLKLSDEQKEELQAALTNAREKIGEYLKNNPGTTRADIVAKVKAHRDEIRQSVVKFLTPEQLTKWDSEIAKFSATDLQSFVTSQCKVEVQTPESGRGQMSITTHNRSANQHSRARSAVAYVLVALLYMTPLTTSGQKKSWQAGTMLDVKPHPAESKSENKGKQYDLSIKVGKKVYVVLYVADPGEPEPNNYIGMARTVLIDGKILKFNDLLGHVHSTTILSSRDASSK